MGFFFLQKRSLLAKLILNEYEICLKMLEMAILETQIFKHFWGACPQTPLLKILDPPLLERLVAGTESAIFKRNNLVMFLLNWT